MVQALGFTCRVLPLLGGVEGAHGPAAVLIYQVHHHPCLKVGHSLAAQASEHRVHQVLACSRVLLGLLCCWQDSLSGLVCCLEGILAGLFCGTRVQFRDFRRAHGVDSRGLPRDGLRELEHGVFDNTHERFELLHLLAEDLQQGSCV